MTRSDRVVGLAVASVAVLGMAWLSHVPLTWGDATGAQLRLAWRARPERIEECHEQSPEALRALPPHMRQPMICEGRSASYRLQVTRDGTTLADVPVHPGGLRGDRPLYVFQEIDIPPGDTEITVRFTRLEASEKRRGEEASTEDAAGVLTPPDGAARRRDQLTEAVPSSLAFAARLHFAPGQVRLISYDPERRVLFEVRP